MRELLRITSDEDCIDDIVEVSKTMLSLVGVKIKKDKSRMAILRRRLNLREMEVVKRERAV